MWRSLYVAFGLCCLALPAAGQPSDIELVPSVTSEAVPANPYRLTVSGNCKSLPVEARFQRDETGGHASVTVSVGKRHTVYGPGEPFLRDLFSNNAAYRFGITCGSMG